MADDKNQEFVFNLDEAFEQTLYTSQLNIISRIGKGCFGSVYLATEKNTEKLVALKVCQFFPDEIKNFLLSESLILSLIDSKYFPKIYHCEIRNGIFLMSMEYCPGKTLQEFLDERGKMRESEIFAVLVQLVEALEYLHCNNIVHRDLKLENIIITSDLKLKICDFGFSKFINKNQQLRDFCGSEYYCSPEVLRRIPYDGPMNDIWSLGICLLTMLIGTDTFFSIFDNLGCEGLLLGSSFYQEIYRKNFLNNEIKLLITILKSIFKEEKKGRACLRKLRQLAKISFSYKEYFSPDIIDPFTLHQMAKLVKHENSLIRRIRDENLIENHIYTLIYKKIYERPGIQIQTIGYPIHDLKKLSNIIFGCLESRQRLFCCFKERFMNLHFMRRVSVDEFLDPSGLKYSILRKTYFTTQIQLIFDDNLVVELRVRGRFRMKIVKISGNETSFTIFLAVAIRSFCYNRANKN